MLLDDVDVGDVLPCKVCGRPPKIATGYKGYEGGGPYIITCAHGKTDDEIREWADRVLPGPCPFTLSRSWDQTRAVTNWNAFNSTASKAEGA